VPPVCHQINKITQKACKYWRFEGKSGYLQDHLVLKTQQINFCWVLLFTAYKELIVLTGNQVIIRKEITLHCLRHSIATHLIDKGANIAFVQQLLGHSEIDTAHLYSKRRKQQLSIREKLS
jgi:integrase